VFERAVAFHHRSSDKPAPVVAAGGFHCGESAVSWRIPDARSSGRWLYGDAASGLSRGGSRGIPAIPRRAAS
jgi:hypothetical protein